VRVWQAVAWSWSLDCEGAVSPCLEAMLILFSLRNKTERRTRERTWLFRDKSGSAQAEAIPQLISDRHTYEGTVSINNAGEHGW